ncbi:MAG: o-succinylbenzoate synthase [Bacteroidales bacterium]
MDQDNVARLEALPLGRLDEIEFVTVRLPFVSPFGTSVHTWTCKEALLLRVASDGVTGWGECVADPDPFYAYETTTTARHILRDFLLPLVTPESTLGSLQAAFRRVRGHGMAKATVENALLDLCARRAGKPLHALLGYPRRPIMSGISIGLQASIDALVAAVAEAVDAGYHRVKMKIARGKDVEWVRAVRNAFPDVRLMVDANGDYHLADARHLQQLDEFGLMMIEQPLSYSDIAEHRHLQCRLATAICLDESIHSEADAIAAIELGACRVINIKQGRVGGLLESIRIAQACAARGVAVWSGGMDETGIGRAVNIHLQTVDGFTLPGDTSETRRYFHEDIVEPGVVLGAGGFIDIPGGPGTGMTIVPERLARYQLESERVR